MSLTITQKIIQSHLLEGEMQPGEEIGLQVDQTLCQDATGTLVMLELEAMGVKRTKAQISAQYVDHNLIQEDYKNPDDHLFLQSAAQRFGVWFSRPGNGVSHPIHMECFGRPGQILVGSDSHTCAGGALGMLSMGAGGLEVAMAMSGYPFFVTMPKIFGIRLVNRMPKWVSAKDIILEMLRRHGVKGGVNYVLEYKGPGVNHLSLWDRHVIANMGAELGATGTVFPSDAKTRQFLREHHRAQDWIPLQSDRGAHFDKEDEIDLATLVPLIALPSSPDKVVPVRKVSGLPIYQAYIGSSANPGYRDFAISAAMVKHATVSEGVSYDINPTSRNMLEQLADDRSLSDLVRAGARIHQAGCNGCIGMGQAPATGRNSLRTTPRNFPGRSGTEEDSVFLCSPETATASAMQGVITDPRDLHLSYPKLRSPQKLINLTMMQAPLSPAKAAKVKLIKGPNIVTLPTLKRLPTALTLVVLLKVGDNVSTDEIMPAGARVLPYRSNIPKISEFAFDRIDKTYPERALTLKHKKEQHLIVAGENYGQGSSREHAALAPRYLGLQCVIAKSFARIHWENLINFGILPLTFKRPSDYRRMEQGETVRLHNIIATLRSGKEMRVSVGKLNIICQHQLSRRQIDILAAGGLINWVKKQQMGKKKTNNARSSKTSS